MVLRNEMYTNVVMIYVSRYSLVIQRKAGEVHKRTARSCDPCEHSPNSLGRVDKHKVGFAHRQMHPSMIGVIDCLDSSKDVGQSGMISPWADVSALSDSDVNKYPNMKYELFDFIRTHFPSSMSFKCNNIQEYNAILDKLTMFSRIDLNFYVFSGDGKDED